MKLSRTKIARLLKINNQSRKNIKKNKGKQQHMRAHPQQRFSKSLTNDDLILDLNTAPRKVHRSVNNLRQKQRQPNLRYQTLRRLKRRNQPLYNQEGGMDENEKNTVQEIIEKLNQAQSNNNNNFRTTENIIKKFDESGLIFNQFENNLPESIFSILTKLTAKYKYQNITNTNIKKVFDSFTNNEVMTSYLSGNTNPIDTPENFKKNIITPLEEFMLLATKPSTGPKPDMPALTPIPMPELSELSDISSLPPALPPRRTSAPVVPAPITSDPAATATVVPAPTGPETPVAADTAPAPVVPKPTKVTITVYNHLGVKGTPAMLDVTERKITGDTTDIVSQIKANVTACNAAYPDIPNMAVLFINGQKQENANITAEDLKTKLNAILAASQTLDKITINVRSKEYVFFKELLYGKLYYLIDVQFIRNIVTYLLSDPQFKDLTLLKPAGKVSEDKSAALWKGKEEEEFYGGTALVNGGALVNGNDSQALVKYSGSGGGHFFKDKVEQKDDYRSVGLNNVYEFPAKVESIPKFKDAILNGFKTTDSASPSRPTSTKPAYLTETVISGVDLGGGAKARLDNPENKDLTARFGFGTVYTTDLKEIEKHYIYDGLRLGYKESDLMKDLDKFSKMADKINKIATDSANADLKANIKASIINILTKNEATVGYITKLYTSLLTNNIKDDDDDLRGGTKNTADLKEFKELKKQNKEVYKLVDEFKDLYKKVLTALFTDITELDKIMTELYAEYKRKQISKITKDKDAEIKNYDEIMALAKGKISNLIEAINFMVNGGNPALQTKVNTIMNRTDAKAIKISPFIPKMKTLFANATGSGMSIDMNLIKPDATDTAEANAEETTIQTGVAAKLTTPLGEPPDRKLYVPNAEPSPTAVEALRKLFANIDAVANLSDLEILQIKYYLNYLAYTYLTAKQGTDLVNQLENKNILQKVNYFYQNIGLGDFSHSFGTWTPTNRITQMLTVFRNNNKITEIKAGDQNKLSDYKTYFKHIVEKYAKNQQMLYGGGERKNSLLFELGQIVNDENYFKELVKSIETQLSKYRGQIYKTDPNLITDNNHFNVDQTYDILTTLFSAYKNLAGQDIETVYAKIQNKDRRSRTNKEDIILFEFLNTNGNIDKIRDIIAGITRSMVEIAIAYERELRREGVKVVSSATLAEQRKAREAAAALAKQQRLEEARKRSGDGSGTGMSNEGMALIVQLRERVKLLEDKEKEAIEKAAKASISAMMGDAEALGQNFRFDVFYPENNPFFKLSGPNGRSFENEIRNVALDTMKGQLKSLKAEITDIYKLEFSEIQNVAQSYKALKALNDTFATPPAGQTADDKYKVAQDISAKAKDFKLVLEALEAKMKKSEAEAASLVAKASAVGKEKKDEPVDEAAKLKKAQEEAKAAESSVGVGVSGAKSSGSGGPMRGGADSDFAQFTTEIGEVKDTDTNADSSLVGKFEQYNKTPLFTKDQLTEIQTLITTSKPNLSKLKAKIDAALAAAPAVAATSGAAPAVVAAKESGTASVVPTKEPGTAQVVAAKEPGTAAPTKESGADFITRIESITATNLLTDSLKAEIEKLIAEGSDKYTAEEITKMSEAVKNNKIITPELQTKWPEMINKLTPKASGAAAAPVVAGPEKALVVAESEKAVTASEAASKTPAPTTASEAKDEKLDKAVTDVKSASEKVQEASKKATDDLQKAISAAGKMLMELGKIEIERAVTATTFAEKETEKRDIALKAEMRKKDEEKAKKKKDDEAAKKGPEAAATGTSVPEAAAAVPDASGPGDGKPVTDVKGADGKDADVKGADASKGAKEKEKGADGKGAKGGGKRILRGGAELEKVTGSAEEGGPVGTESSTVLNPEVNLENPASQEAAKASPVVPTTEAAEAPTTETAVVPTTEKLVVPAKASTEAVVPAKASTEASTVASTVAKTETPVVASTEASPTEEAVVPTTEAAEAPKEVEGSGNSPLDAALQKVDDALAAALAAALKGDSPAGGQRNNNNKKKRYTVKRKSRKTKNHKKPKGGSKKKKNKSMKPRSKKRQA